MAQCPPLNTPLMTFNDVVLETRPWPQGFWPWPGLAWRILKNRFSCPWLRRFQPWPQRFWPRRLQLSSHQLLEIMPFSVMVFLHNLFTLVSCAAATFGLNSAVRLIFYTRRSDHITPLWIYFHWLPYSILNTNYERLCSNACVVLLLLNDQTIALKQNFSNVRSIPAHGDIVAPSHQSDWGTRSSAVAGSSRWNVLPMAWRLIRGWTLSLQICLNYEASLVWLIHNRPHTLEFAIVRYITVALLLKQIIIRCDTVTNLCVRIVLLFSDIIKLLSFSL